jgi:hypothetical protein
MQRQRLRRPAALLWGALTLVPLWNAMSVAAPLPGVPQPLAPSVPADQPGREEAPRSTEAGETRIQPTLSLAVLLTLGVEYRSNVRFEPGGDGDAIGVLTPELQLRYQTKRVTWKTAYSRTAEAYLDKTELNNSNRRQGVDTALQARLTPRLGTTLTAAWRDTHDPAEDVLAGAPTLASVRTASREWSVGNGWTYRVTPAVESDVAYRYVNVAFSSAGAISREEYQAEIGSRIRVTAQDALLPRYGFRLFMFDTGTEYRIHTLKGAYEHTIGPRMLIRLQAGGALLDGPAIPRVGYTTGILSEWRHERLTVRAEYGRDFAALGEVDGVLVTHTVTLAATQRFSRSLEASLSGRYRWQQDLAPGSGRAVYQIWSSQVEVAKTATDWLVLRASSSVVQQSTAPAPLSGGVVRDFRAMVSATFVATTPLL